MQDAPEKWPVATTTQSNSSLTSWSAFRSCAITVNLWRASSQVTRRTAWQKRIQGLTPAFLTRPSM